MLSLLQCIYLSLLGCRLLSKSHIMIYISLPILLIPSKLEVDWNHLVPNCCIVVFHKISRGFLLALFELINSIISSSRVMIPLNYSIKSLHSCSQVLILPRCRFLYQSHARPFNLKENALHLCNNAKSYTFIIFKLLYVHQGSLF